MNKLYWMSFSHPSQAARRMLELKQIEFSTVDVLPFTQRVHLRLAGFRGGTVPALRLGGQRVQGSRRIAAVLDELYPDPPLIPTEAAQRARVLEAERWGEETLQPVPRRIARYGMVHDPTLLRWGAERLGLPAPALVAALTRPAARYYLRTVEIDGRRGDRAGVLADLAALPGLLDHVDELLAEGVLAAEPPNAATIQILSSVRVLAAFTDLRGLLDRPCATAARELFPRYPEPIPSFLPREWLPRRAEPTM